MTWAKGTIKLDAANRIFSPVTFEEIKIDGDGKTVGYKACGVLPPFGEFEAEDASLTALCRRIFINVSGI
jgi:hypothetical protein